MLLTLQHSEPLTGVLEDSFHWGNSEVSPGHLNCLCHRDALAGGYGGPVTEEVEETETQRHKEDQEEGDQEEEED